MSPHSAGVPPSDSDAVLHRLRAERDHYRNALSALRGEQVKLIDDLKTYRAALEIIAAFSAYEKDFEVARLIAQDAIVGRDPV